jgi:hypothetical protein
MALDQNSSGKIIEQSAEELLRIWRLARATARPHVFPGLLDGVMGDFFTRAGQLMAAGAAPEAVWSGLGGLIRVSPRLGTKELTGEWAVAMEVLSAACESFDASPEVGEWLARAIAEAERGVSALGANPTGDRPERIAVAQVHGDMSAPKRLLGGAAVDDRG